MGLIDGFEEGGPKVLLALIGVEADGLIRSGQICGERFVDKPGTKGGNNQQGDGKPKSPLPRRGFLRRKIGGNFLDWLFF